jgi:HlyD family secretion protein
MKRPPLPVVAIVIVLVALAGGTAWYLLQKPFRYAGTLEATNVDISARLPANIDEMRVREGDRVKKGDVLAVLSCEEYKIAARLARQTWVRDRKLARIGSVSQERLDAVRSQMEDTQTRLKWCTIASPIDGKVLSRYHEPGEWMAPGMKILTVANIRDIWAYIYVPQPMLAHLSPGMKLPGYLPELSDRKFEGKIVKINDEAEFTPKNVQTRTERERLVFGVKISFAEANADEILKPGMTIEVQLPEQ